MNGAPGPDGSASLASLLTEDAYRAYLVELLRGQLSACRTVVRELRQEGASVTAIYEGLFRRSLYDVGEMWARGEASVADEHLATAVTESLIHASFPDLFSTERVGLLAVVSCLANERHELGGRMVADVFELSGWDTRFLGTDTPLDTLRSVLERESPDLLALSLAMPERVPVFLQTLRTVREAFPDLPVVFGGRAFHGGVPSEVRGFPGAVHVPTLEALSLQIGHFPRRPAPREE